MTAHSIPRVRVGISACLLGQRVRYEAHSDNAQGGDELM